MDTKLQVTTRTNGQHKSLELKAFGVNFSNLIDYITLLLNKVKAPETVYTFFLHGKISAVETKDFAVKILKDKYLHFTFYKAEEKVYGTLSGKGLSKKEMQNLFSCLKTWENGEGKIFSIPQEKPAGNFMTKRAEEVEREAESLLEISLKDAFTALLSAKVGSARNDLYRIMTKHLIDFTKNNKKNLSKDISIFTPGEPIVPIMGGSGKRIDPTTIYANQLLQKLVSRFIYKHNDQVMLFFADLFLKFYQNPDVFDMKVLDNKKTLWEAKMLETIVFTHVPNQGSRKFSWNVHKEKDFQNICKRFSLDEDNIKSFRDLYFRDDYGELIDVHKKQLAEGLESADSLKKDLAEVRANYDSEQAAIISLQQQIEERKKRVGAMRVDISSREQAISKLAEMSF